MTLSHIIFELLGQLTVTVISKEMAANTVILVFGNRIRF